MNKKGHREKVSAGVCNLGSSTVMNGCNEKTVPNVNYSSHAQTVTHTFIRVKKLVIAGSVPIFTGDARK